MKKTDFVKPTIGSRLAAAFLLIAFISTTCQNPDNPAKPAEQKKAEEIEFPPPTLPTVTPLVFFLDDEYKPAAEDTGRTGITTVGDMPLNRVVVSSEDLEAEPVVHLFGRSVPDGVTTYTTATMFFAGKESVFPYKCRVVQRQEQRTEEYTASAAFSAYDDATETFSVDYENGSQVFNNLVLNKGVFGAYQFSNKVSESENIRMRNAVVAMALWTALEIQGEERGLAAAVPFYELNENGAAMYLSGGRGSPWGWIFLGISIAALALAVILCPPTSFALTASSAGISLLGTATITSTAATIAYGVAGVAALAAGFLIELEPPKDTPPVQPAPPSEKPSITGTAGPAGGTLVDKRDSGLNYDLEVIPYTADTTLTFEQALSLNPRIGGVTGWRVPTLDELNRIYQLYLIYGKLTFSQFSPFPTIEGSLWTGTEYEEMSAARIVAGFAWALNLGVRATGDNFSENFGLASKDMYLGACLIRRVN